MTPKVKIANTALGLVFNTLFRTSYSPVFMRKAFDKMAGVSKRTLLRKYPGIKLTSGAVGNIATETIDPGIATQREILYVHGGGYFMGSIHSYRRNALRIAYRCRARVTLFNYRLAPEHPFPAALEDAKAVYLDLRKKNSGIPLFIGGDSAGGGLTLATVLSLRDENLPLPKAVFLISPWTDLTGSQPSVKSNAGRDVWLSKKHLEHWAPWYAGTQARCHPLVSPFFADFACFPPLLVQVGDQEVLFDEAKAIADKVILAGGKAVFDPGRDMQHDWFLSLPFLAESKRAMKSLADFIEKNG